MTEKPQGHTPEEIEEFMQAQVKIYADAADKIHEEALAFHRMVCDGIPGEMCEFLFMAAFAQDFSDTLDELTRRERLKMQADLNPN